MKLPTKELSEELSIPISNIFTKTFIEGKIPQNWKDAIVTKKEKKSLQIIIIQLA